MVHKLRNRIYNFIIKNATEHCYKNCLEYFSDNTVILDVGIGNGAMMDNFHSLIKSKRLKITGIDVNKHYLHHCECIIKNHQLKDNVEIYCKSIEDYEPVKKEYFDFILFSMSFMLIHNQGLILDRIKDWLKPRGKILFFQTMFNKRFWLMDIIKPRLKYFTTIDFGKVTYEKDFISLLDERKLFISEDRLIKKKWFGGEYRMIIASFGND